MTSTTTRAGRAATDTAGSAGSQVLRAAGRQLLATAGNQVLKVAVDRAVGKVDDVAGRLDAVASGERRKPSRPPTNRKPQRPTKQDDRPASPVRVKVGAAFNLVVQQAIRLLQLVQRLAQQLLAAVSQLFRRGGDDAEAADADAAETQGVDRVAPRKKAEKVEKAERPDGGRTAEPPRPATGQPGRAPQAQRRKGPRPAARDAAGGPRRVAGDRPVRAARND